MKGKYQNYNKHKSELCKTKSRNLKNNLKNVFPQMNIIEELADLHSQIDRI